MCVSVLTVMSGVYNGTFMHIIEKELQQIATEWNHHIIRPTSTAYVHAGCPEVLYFIPSNILNIIIFIDLCHSDSLNFTDKEDYVQPFDNDDLQYVKSYAHIPQPPVSFGFYITINNFISHNMIL